MTNTIHSIMQDMKWAQPGEAELFEKLVSMACPPKPRRRRVQTAKKCGAGIPACPSPGSTGRDACATMATFLEELIDACVLELHFPDEAKTKNLLFIDQVSELLTRTAGVPPALADIEDFVKTANAPTHPIRTQLARIESDSLDLFAVIKQEGRV